MPLAPTLAVPVPRIRRLFVATIRHTVAAAAAALSPPAVTVAVAMLLFLSALSPLAGFAAAASLLRMILSAFHPGVVHRFHNALLFLKHISLQGS